jgi:dnd system-associated protein 4
MLNLFESKRLARAQDKDEVFKTLDIKKDSRHGFFQQMTDIYVFALALGLKNRKRSKIVGPTSESIHVSYFNEDQKKFFDMAVLYSEAGRLGSLDKASEESVNEMKKTIEEYTNGGLQILLDSIHAHPEDAFNIIVRLIGKQLKEGLPEDIDEDISWA